MMTTSIRWASTDEWSTLLETLVTYLINDGIGIEIQICLKTKPHHRSKCHPVLPIYLTTLTCQTKPLEVISVHCLFKWDLQELIKVIKWKGRALHSPLKSNPTPKDFSLRHLQIFLSFQSSTYLSSFSLTPKLRNNSCVATGWRHSPVVPEMTKGKALEIDIKILVEWLYFMYR